MTVTTKAASGNYTPVKVPSSANQSGQAGAGNYDSVKQGLKHTVTRSAVSAHTGATSGSWATTEKRSSQK